MEVFKTTDGMYGKIECWGTCPAGHRFVKKYRLWEDSNQFSSLIFASCPTCYKNKILAGFFAKGEIPSRFWGKSVDSFDLSLVEAASEKGDVRGAKEKAQAIKAACLDYVQNIKEAIRSGRSLIFSGGTGTGKTHLACGIAIEALRQGFTVQYCLTPDYCRKIEACRVKKNQDGGSEIATLQQFAANDLLILDKVGDRGLTPYERKIVQALLDARYNLNKATIITTNLTITHLEAAIGSDCLDGLRECGGRAYAFVWESVRSVLPMPEPKPEILPQICFFPDDAVHPLSSDGKLSVAGVEEVLP